jgi:hypothetical protein
MSTNGTLFEGEVPMTHRVFDLRGFDNRDGGAVGGGRGYRRWTEAGQRGLGLGAKFARPFDQNRTFKFKIDMNAIGRNILLGPPPR